MTQNLKDLIRQHRIAKGMTQLDLARQLGYENPQFVSLMERGVSKIPMETLGKLIEILGINEEEVLKRLVSHYVEKVQQGLEEGKRRLRERS